MRPPGGNRTADVLVWGAVTLAYLLWTSLSVFSLLELMGAHAGLSYVDWLSITWTCAAVSVLSAVTSCLLPSLGGVENSCCGALRSETLSRYKAPLRLHWLVHTCCTLVIAIVFTQFYTRYRTDELGWLDEARRRPALRPDALDVVIIMHWRELHLLVVVVWLVLLSLALVLRLDHYLLAPPISAGYQHVPTTESSLQLPSISPLGGRA